MNYFRCKICNGLVEDDTDFCSYEHQIWYRACRDEFHTWLLYPVMYTEYADWEYSFLPLDKGGIHPQEGQDEEEKSET